MLRSRDSEKPKQQQQQHQPREAVLTRTREQRHERLYTSLSFDASNIPVTPRPT